MLNNISTSRNVEMEDYMPSVGVGSTDSMQSVYQYDDEFDDNYEMVHYRSNLLDSRL